MSEQQSARAAWFHGSGVPLELKRFPVPQPIGGETLVRVLCCTLCTSDLHTHSGRRSGPTPAVLGHEIVGRIEAFGSDAPRDLPQVGERITWSIAACCGSCFFCREGLTQKCARLHKYGHERSMPERPFTGGLADVVLLAPGTACFRVPDTLPDPVAAMANCATATAAALLRTAGNVANRSVVILGAGVLGLTAAALARSRQARHVIVSDPDSARRDKALSFGATRTISADLQAILGIVHESSDDRGADVVLECAGTAESVETALTLPRTGGVVMLAGTVRPTPSVALDPERIVRRLLTIRGVHNYVAEDLRTALEFLAGPGKDFPFVELIDRTFPLSEVDAAFTEAHRLPGKRIAVVP